MTPNKLTFRNQFIIELYCVFVPSKAIDTRGRKLLTTEQYDVPECFLHDLEGILISGGEVKDRVIKQAKEITEHFKGKNPYALIVLKGASIYGMDLIKRIRLQVPYDFVKVDAGYDGTTPVREPSITGLNYKILEGKDVLIIEDIADTKRTVNLLKTSIQSYSKAVSISIAALLLKPVRNLPEFKSLYIDFGGFTIDDHFVVGGGLDWRDLYRGLAHISVLKKEIYSK